MRNKNAHENQKYVCSCSAKTFYTLHNGQARFRNVETFSVKLLMRV